MLVRVTTTERSRPTRSQWLIWLAALVVLVAVIVVPVSNRITRTGGLVLFFIVWLGLMFLGWHRPAVRFGVLGISLLVAAFLSSPAREVSSSEVLRMSYVDGLRRYDGRKYVWGGESFTGIDCSGLIRRGLIDSLFLRGIRTFDPGLVRHALSLWWNDCSAKALGEMHRGLTVHRFDTPSLNELDHSKVLPGDLAVTRNGVHIMAYLGGQRWIEADPAEGRVIIVKVPAGDNLWFGVPMNIIRWSALAD